MRTYSTPIGSLPSVTTILSATRTESRSSRLTQYKRRADRAGQGVGRAADRGNEVHDRLESILKDPFYSRGHIPEDMRDGWMDSVSPFLATVEDPVHVEAPVWSQFGFAGTLDLIARLTDRELVVSDWKTKVRPFKEEWAGEYKMQLSAYAFAAKERGLGDCTAGKIVIIYPDSPSDVIHMSAQDLSDYWERFWLRLKMFKNIDSGRLVK